MILSALIVALATLAVGVVLGLLLRTLPSVRLQLSGLALLAVALPLGAVLLSGQLMFHMGDGGGVAAVAVAAGVAGVVIALVLARSIVAPLQRVRGASARLAEGELSERVPVMGPNEIAELAHSFNTMADRLEKLFEARSELVAWVSHDLRTPITSLQAMLEAIDDGVIESGDYLDALQGQVRLLGALVEDLFEFSCIDSGAATFELGDVDMVALVSACARGFELEANARGIRLETVLRDDHAVAHCAPDKVERVLTNLLSNALRYTPAGGRIVISLTSGADAVFVSVEDTGVGIAPESMETVFEPFYRADTTRSGGSAGLGLAIARGLIDAQGGRIWAEPPASGGTRVCFVVPTTGHRGRPVSGRARHRSTIS
jgi:signal transduction histidine kinase